MNKYKGYTRFRVVDEIGIQQIETGWHILDTFIVNLGLTQTYYPQQPPYNPGGAGGVYISSSDKGSVAPTMAQGLKFLIGWGPMGETLYDGQK